MNSATTCSTPAPPCRTACWRPWTTNSSSLACWLAAVRFPGAALASSSPRPLQVRHINHAEQAEPNASHARPNPPTAAVRQLMAQQEHHDQRHRPDGRADSGDLPVIALQRRRYLAIWLGHWIRLAQRYTRLIRATTGSHHVTNSAFSRIGGGYRAVWHRWRTLFPAWPVPLTSACQAFVRPAANRGARGMNPRGIRLARVMSEANDYDYSPVQV